MHKIGDAKEPLFLATVLPPSGKGTIFQLEPGTLEEVLDMLTTLGFGQDPVSRTWSASLKGGRWTGTINPVFPLNAELIASPERRLAELIRRGWNLLCLYERKLDANSPARQFVTEPLSKDIVALTLIGCVGVEEALELMKAFKGPRRSEFVASRAGIDPTFLEEVASIPGLIPKYVVIDLENGTISQNLKALRA